MTCGLCQLDRPLVNSHLLPAATYKLAREPHRQNPNPIVVTRGRAGSSSRQILEFLASNAKTDSRNTASVTSSLNAPDPTVSHFVTC
jgi:hypothetical protein